MTNLRTALCFFTRLPLGQPDQVTSFAGVVAWFPAVGLVIGILIGLVVWATALALPPLLCGAIGCLAWIAITGGLHMDGVADCGDGMLVEAPREKRLVIMKDSRLGTFGALALFSVVLLKFATLSTLAGTVQPTAYSCANLAGVCAMAAILGRCSTFLAMRLPSARPGGMGSTTVAGVNSRHAFWAGASALAICALNGLAGVAALALALGVAAIFLSAAKKRLGGVTGDVYGCLIELTECAVLTVACI